MSSNPIISCIMAIYNGKKYLRLAIESILAQTFKDFEFIIINDGSTDETNEVLANYKDTRLRIFNNDQNYGLVFSLNRGIDLARGHYIARQDADDISHPLRFDKQISYLEKYSNLVLLGTQVIIIDEQGKKLDHSTLPTHNDQIQTQLLKVNTFAHGSVVMSSHFVKKLGGYREITLAQDYDLWLRLAECGEVANLKESLYFYRYHYEAVSQVKWKEQESWAQLARNLAHQRQSGQEQIWNNQEKIEQSLPLPAPERLLDICLWHTSMNIKINNWVKAKAFLQNATELGLTLEKWLEWSSEQLQKQYLYYEKDNIPLTLQGIGQLVPSSWGGKNQPYKLLKTTWFFSLASQFYCQKQWALVEKILVFAFRLTPELLGNPNFLLLFGKSIGYHVFSLIKRANVTDKI